MTPLLPDLSDRLAELAADRPARPVLVAGGRRVTARDLDERANRFGQALVVRGVAAGSAVGVLLGPVAETLEVVLGARRAGHGVVLLDPRRPAADLADRCRQGGVSGLVLPAAEMELATEAALADGGLHWFFVVGEVDGPPPLLPGAAPYEASLAAYPSTPPEPDGPRLRPRRDPTRTAPALEPRADTLVAVVVRPTLALLDHLLRAMASGTLVVLADATDPGDPWSLVRPLVRPLEHRTDPDPLEERCDD